MAARETVCGSLPESLLERKDGAGRLVQRHYKDGMQNRLFHPATPEQFH
jgi:hypothetical protein